jgi:hypothetical protein
VILIANYTTDLVSPYKFEDIVLINYLVLRGIPSLKHCSCTSCMQARAGEVVLGGAMSAEEAKEGIRYSSATDM